MLENLTECVHAEFGVWKQTHVFFCEYFNIFIPQVFFKINNVEMIVMKAR